MPIRWAKLFCWYFVCRESVRMQIKKDLFRYNPKAVNYCDSVQWQASKCIFLRACGVQTTQCGLPLADV